MSQTHGDIDIELGQPSAPIAISRLSGYPSFARFIAADADAAIYRKYQSLSSRNLLYLQSELHELEGALEEIDIEDAKNKDSDSQEAQRRARLWSHFARADNERAKRHRELQATIKVKLKEYRR